MGSFPAQFPISLRAVPSVDGTAVPLSSLITRINDERGSFREINEEALTDDLRKENEAIDSGREDDESDAEDAQRESDKLKELVKARGEILGHLDEAYNAAMVTLDFVSLLLSKDTPVQASLSISQSLRDVVSLGTLGADKVHYSRVTKAQRHENRQIAKGWKLQSLSDSVNSILASATRLEKEIEKETRYWDQILAVSENGWAVCRLPQERHTLGVRFGFAESAPAFNNRSLGALRRNIDGTIFLDQGAADMNSRRIRTRIQSNGITTGESFSLQQVEDPSSIEAAILFARNAIFEEELWQELNREARLMANQGVRLIGDEVVCDLIGKKRIVLDLHSAEGNESQRHELGNSNNDDITAKMISISLRLLLSYAHRQNHHRRSRPPIPITNRPPPRAPYNLLRPIIMRFHHEAVISSLINLLAPLSRTLIAMDVCESGYTMTAASVSSIIEAKMKSLKQPRPLPEQVIEALILQLSAEITIPLTEPPLAAQSLTIQLVTRLSSLETLFRITVTGPLNKSCKPPPNPSTVDEVKSYLLWATACALAGAFIDLNEQQRSDEPIAVSQSLVRTISTQREDSDSGVRGWELTHHPNILRKIFQNDEDSKELTFVVSLKTEKKHSVEVKAICKYITRHDLVDSKEGDIMHVWQSELAVDGISLQQNGGRQRKMQLSQFITNVGTWDKQSKDVPCEFGESYEPTAMEWA